MFSYPFIHTFVVAADENNPGASGEFFRNFLFEGFTLRCQENNLRIISCRIYIIQCPCDWVNLHHHSTTATIGIIIGHPVLVQGITADIVNMDFY